MPEHARFAAGLVQVRLSPSPLKTAHTMPLNGDPMLSLSPNAQQLLYLVGLVFSPTGPVDQSALDRLTDLYLSQEVSAGSEAQTFVIGRLNVLADTPSFDLVTAERSLMHQEGRFDFDRAGGEGWDFCDFANPVEACLIADSAEEPPQFPSDKDAVSFVLTQAVLGSEFHTMAIQLHAAAGRIRLYWGEARNEFLPPFNKPADTAH